MHSQIEKYDKTDLLCAVVIATMLTVTITTLSFKLYFDSKFESRCTKANGVVMRSICIKKEFVALTE
jgi:hypothetical protein